MTSTKDLIDWLKTLPKGSEVGIDEDGLTLRVVDDNCVVSDAYFEIGGIPEELENG